MAAKKQKIEFAPWEPDVAILDGQAAHEAKNVLPAKRGYTSMPGLAELHFPALGSRPLAVWSRRQNNDTITCVVATASGIYSLESGRWVQKYSGTAVSDNRQIVDYGSDLYVLWGTKLLRASVGATVGSFSEVSGAPLGNRLCVVQDFLCIGELSDYPGGIHWSAIDDPTSWPAIGTTEAINKQSDRQIFPVGGKVQAIVGGLSAGVTGIIFLEHAVQKATYVGVPYIFQFEPIERSRGILAPKSAVVAGSICIYLAEDGWRATDGSTSKSIGAERVDDWFFSHCSSDRLGEVMGVHDTQRRLCWWAFSSDICPAGQYDRVLVYNYEMDRWSWGEIACEYLHQDNTRGLTLEDLDAYGQIDGLPFASLDSAALRPGRVVLGGFTTGHKLASMNGPNLEGVITTAEFGGDRFMVHGLRPLVDGAEAEALPVYRSRQMDAQAFGDYAPQSRDGVCYQHISTVYLTAQVRIPAGVEWRHAVGVEALIEPEGGM